MDVVRRAFSLVPDYLATAEGSRGVHNLMDTGVQLGRRFRALKLWMVLRHLGAEGIRSAIVSHIQLAQLFSHWIDGDPDFERLAPVPFSVVCFRANPRHLALADAELDTFNERVLEAVNRTGEVFLSHTRLHDRFVIRLAVGHLRTSQQHVERAWALLRLHAARIALDMPH
jgi:aromatic-L-amino-acid decarboxylase